MLADKRQFLGLGVALGASLITSEAMAQGAAAEPAARGRRPIPHRKATTTVLFQAPKDKFINGVATSPQGLWLIEQKESGGPNSSYHYKDGRPLEPASDLRETAWQVDDKGAVKKTVITEGHNTSGFAVGDNSLWVGCNQGGNNGVIQTSMESKTISHRQVPFGPPQDGGGIHGLDWHDGKLWIAALRLRAAVRIDPVTWNTEMILPFPAGFDRFHGCAYDASNDTLLVVTGNNSTGHIDGKAGLARLDAKTGNMVEVIDFAPNTCDPHGLTFHQGKLISCDAGLHPGWAINDSPFTGAIFEIHIA
jgi:hypothetical protein